MDQKPNNGGRVYGIITGVLTFLTGSMFALPVEYAAIQVIVVCVSGAFYYFTSVSVAWLREIYKERRERRALQRSTERSVNRESRP